MKILMAAILVVTLIGCTNPDSATRVLESNGYTNIRITGYDWFGCSKDDFYHTGFVAIGPTGKQVEGCVCEGMLFKNSTIRFK